MAYTTIKIKRAEETAAFLDYVADLQRGEIVVDFEAQLLYVGQGSGNYLTFLSSEATTTPHALDSGTHSVSGKRKGSSIRVDSSAGNSFSIKRLGYYDLGHINLGASYPIDPTDKDFSLTTHDIGDEIGLSNAYSRWHFIHSEHVGRYQGSIFVTTYNSDEVDMTHSGINTVTGNFGYKVKEVPYSTVTMDEGVAYPFVVDYDGSNKTVSFRKLTTSDIDGIDSIGTTSIVDLTGPLNSIFYTQNTSNVTSLSYNVATNGSAVDRSVLIKTGSNSLDFRLLEAADLPSTSIITANSPENNDSLRYNGTTWVNNRRVKLLLDYDLGDVDSENLTGIRIDNYGGEFGSDVSMRYKCVSLSLARYEYGNGIEASPDGRFRIFYPTYRDKGLDSSFNSTAGAIYNEYLDSNNGVVFSTDKGRKDLVGETDYNNILFYNSRVWNNAIYPQMQFHSFGTISIFADTVAEGANGTDTSKSISSSNFSSYIEGHTNTYRDFFIRSRSDSTLIRKSGAFDSYSIFEIEERTISIHADATSSTNNSRMYSAIKFGDLNFATTNNLIGDVVPRFSLIDAQNINTRNHGYLIFNSVLNSIKGSAIAFNIGQITASSDQGSNARNTTAAGINITSITNGYTGNVASIRNAYGISIFSITSDSASTSTTAKSTGLLFNSITGYNATGVQLSSITSYNNTIGLLITDLTSTSGKQAAIYIDPDIDSDDASITPTGKYNIYSKNGIHYFAGLVDITGDQLKVTRDNDDDVAIMIPKGSIDITGAENTNSIRVIKGNIDIITGNYIVREGNFKSIITTDQSISKNVITINQNEYFTENNVNVKVAGSSITDDDFEKLKILEFNSTGIGNFSSSAHGVFNIRDGLYDGQRIFITYTGSTSYLAFFDHRYTGGNMVGSTVSGTTFTAGNFDGNIQFGGAISAITYTRANKYFHLTFTKMIELVWYKRKHNSGIGYWNVVGAVDTQPSIGVDGIQ